MVAACQLFWIIFSIVLVLLPLKYLREFVENFLCKQEEKKNRKEKVIYVKKGSGDIQPKLSENYI